MGEKPVRKVLTAFHAILFVLLLTGFSIANLVLHERAEVSSAENRRLAEFPRLGRDTLVSGKFSEAVDAYMNDRFFVRELLLGLSSQLSAWQGLPSDTEILLVRGGDLFLAQEGGGLLVDPIAEAAGATIDPFAQAAGAIPLDPQPATSGLDQTMIDPGNGLPVPGHAGTEADAQAYPADEPAAIVNEVLIVGNQGFEILSYADAAAEYYNAALRRFAGAIPEGVPVYSMIVPSHLSHMDPESYGGPFGADQAASIKKMYTSMGERIRSIDVWGALNSHRDDYIYFRTDHHWTARGAYLAYSAYAEAAGFEPVPLSRYKKEEIETFLGSFHLLTQSRRLAAAPDRIEIFRPFLDHEYKIQSSGGLVQGEVIDMGFATSNNKYQIFISSDRPYGVISTPEAPERSILIFKDSYGNALVPFLIPHYREIHILDPRYFDRNVFEFFEAEGVDEVLFISYFAVVAGARGYARNLNRVMDLPRTADVVDEGGAGS